MSEFYAVKIVFKDGKEEVQIIPKNDLPEYDENHPFEKKQVVHVKGRGKNKIYGIVLNYGDDKDELSKLMALDNSNDQAGKEDSTDDMEQKGKKEKKGKKAKKKTDTIYTSDEEKQEEASAVKEAKRRRHNDGVTNLDNGKGKEASSIKKKGKNSNKKMDTIYASDEEKQEKGSAVKEAKRRRHNDDVTDLDNDDGKQASSIKQKGTKESCTASNSKKNEKIKDSLNKNKYVDTKNADNSAKKGKLKELIKNKEKELEALKKKCNVGDDNEDSNSDLETLTKYSEIIPDEIEPLMPGGKLLIPLEFREMMLSESNDERTITSCVSQVMAQTYERGPGIGKYCARGISKNSEEDKLPLPHTVELIGFCRLIEKRREQRAKDANLIPKKSIADKEIVTAINLKIRDLMKIKNKKRSA